jgi:SLOG family YspA-like protein
MGMGMKAILVTGSRDWFDESRVYTVLERILPDILINGDCRGLDKTAKHWGLSAPDVSVITMPAQWYVNGFLDRGAGHKRNAEMLKELLRLRDLGYEISVEAWPTAYSKGTFNMMELSEAAGVKVNNHGFVKEKTA